MAIGLVCGALAAFGQDPAHPLKAPDRSSPRAALKTFLEDGDTFAAFLARDYLPSPSRAGFAHCVALGEALVQGLDMSQVPPAARPKVGRAAALALYEVLSRIQLPPLAEIPGPGPRDGAGSTNVVSWTIPDTEIVLLCVPNGPHGPAFLFSPETVAHADRFFERVRALPYTRPMPLENMSAVLVRGGGWMVPYHWVQAMPAWLLSPLAGQAGWKWIALALVLGLAAVLLRLVFRLSHSGNSGHPFLRALAQVSLPAFFLAAVPVVAYVALIQLNMRGRVGSAIELMATAVVYVAGAWISWRTAPVVAEAIIASPQIAPESIDAHLIRICTRLVGIAGGAGLLAMGADRLGVPVYGIVAGLGVGGLAIALAAQPTIENLIGGLSLFADKPIRVGDSCRCGSAEGTVEAIGLRSTRIRGPDRTLTTIPNAELSKMAIVNLALRDRMLIQSVVGLHSGTRPDQLRYLLARIRELLRGHPRVDPESARVSFVGFGASSLDIEVVAYVMTQEKAEFLGIREDIWLQVMDIVEQSGSTLALPSQTLYLGRDHGLDAQRTERAEALVREWRSAEKPAPRTAEHSGTT